LEVIVFAECEAWVVIEVPHVSPPFDAQFPVVAQAAARLDKGGGCTGIVIDTGARVPMCPFGIHQTEFLFKYHLTFS